MVDKVLPAQVPVVDPAQVTVGVLPIMMNFGDFFMSGGVWSKSRDKHPLEDFDTFWNRKLLLHHESHLNVRACFDQMALAN